MRIGVLITAYNCESYIDDCLEPWLNLRDEYNFVIACNSGMFKDYLEMGIEEKNEGTLNKLVKKRLDCLTAISGKNLIDEDNSRDISLDFLNGGRFGRGNKCDLLIVIDGDEVFTEQNIRDILDFVMKNPNHDGYKINFKNHTINKGLFTYDYEHDRIFWMNRHGGIRRFWFDNNFEYGDHYDGISTYKYSDSIAIPKSVAYVDHYSWLSTDSRTKDKILYQNKRYHGINYEIPEGLRCGFEWDNEKDCVRFSSTFWPGRGMQVPILHQMTDGPYTFDFKLDFNRAENKITIETFETNENCLFEISDINKKHIYSCNLNISKGSNYWIIPSSKQFDLDEKFEGFNIKVKKDNQLIHDENLYLKTNLNKHHNINLIIGSAHIDDSLDVTKVPNKRLEDYILSFDNIRKFKDNFNNITIIETISKEKITYLEDSGFNVYYSELQNSDSDKGVNWMKHIQNFIQNGNKDDINVCLTGRYLLEDDNSILKIIDDYMINDDYEFIAKNCGDIYGGYYDGKAVHSFLFLFKKDKFLEFMTFLEEKELKGESVEWDINEFLKISEKCKILPKEYYLGVKTNYYHENNQYIV